MNRITKIIITALIFTIVSTLTVYLLTIVFNRITISNKKDDVVNKEILKKDTLKQIEKNKEIENLKREIENLKKSKENKNEENKKTLNDEIVRYTTEIQFYVLNNKKKSLKDLYFKLNKLKKYFAIKKLDNNTNRLLRISIKSIKNEMKSIKTRPIRKVSKKDTFTNKEENKKPKTLKKDSTVVNKEVNKKPKRLNKDTINDK